MAKDDSSFGQVFETLKLYLLVSLLAVLSLSLISYLQGKSLDFAISMMSAFVGAVFSSIFLYMIVSAQLKRDDEVRRKNEEIEAQRKEEEKILLSHSRYPYVQSELENNFDLIKELKHLLDGHNDPNVNIWDYAISIVDSLSTELYDDFTKNNLQHKLNANEQIDLYHAYELLKDLSKLVHRTREKEILSINGNLKTNETREEMLNKVKDKTAEVYSQLEKMEDKRLILNKELFDEPLKVQV